METKRAHSFQMNLPIMTCVVCYEGGTMEVRSVLMNA
jgi:hypothetical protein